VIRTASTRVRLHAAVALALLSLCVSSPGSAVANEPPAAGERTPVDLGRVSRSMLKVFVRHRPIDFAQPWSRGHVESRTGSAVIIEGRRILTAAHVVADAVMIEVQRADRPTRYAARVAHVSHQADLALLEVEDPDFFRGAVPVKLGALPQLQQAVALYGFPVGGDGLSITRGVVSRIELRGYVHSQERLLAVQIDAAVNPGSSGGAAISNGALVGIAMQSLPQAQNTGYIVPVPLVHHFLEDVSDGRVDGMPQPGIQWSPLRSEDHRRALDVPAEIEGGVLVTQVAYGSTGWGVLEPQDVILSVADSAVGSDGTIEGPNGLRLEFPFAFQRTQSGRPITLDVLRHSQRLRLEATLKAGRSLVQGHLYDQSPPFVLVGGIVFQPLSLGYMALYDRDPQFLYMQRYRNLPTEDQLEAIVAGPILDNRLTRGRPNIEGMVVARVNGIVPRDLRHLARIVDDPSARWLRIELDGGLEFALDLTRARAEEAQILASYDVPFARSRDLIGAGALEELVQNR
jgi:S1-C subfamily serine protease